MTHLGLLLCAGGSLSIGLGGPVGLRNLRRIGLVIFCAGLAVLLERKMVLTFGRDAKLHRFRFGARWCKSSKDQHTRAKTAGPVHSARNSEGWMEDFALAGAPE
jgi:hypothetical protein